MSVFELRIVCVRVIKEHSHEMTEIGPPPPDPVFDVESKELKTAREAEEKRFEPFRVNGVSIADLPALDEIGLMKVEAGLQGTLIDALDVRAMNEALAFDRAWRRAMSEKKFQSFRVGEYSISDLSALDDVGLMQVEIALEGLMNAVDHPKEARKLVVFAQALQRQMARTMLDPTIKTVSYNTKLLVDTDKTLVEHKAASLWTRTKDLVWMDAKTNRLAPDIERLSQHDVELRHTWFQLQGTMLNLQSEITRLIRDFMLDEIDKPESIVSMPSDFERRVEFHNQIVRWRQERESTRDWVRGFLVRMAVIAYPSVSFGMWLGPWLDANGYNLFS